MRALLLAVLGVVSACSSNTCEVKQLASCSGCIVRGGVWFPSLGTTSYWGQGGVSNDGTLAIGMCTSLWFAHPDGSAPSSVDVPDLGDPPLIRGFAMSPGGTAYVASETKAPNPQQCQCVDTHLVTATSHGLTHAEATQGTAALTAGSEGFYQEARQGPAGAIGPLIAYDPAGAERWSQPIVARVLAHGPDKVFAAAGSDVQALDTSGQLLWSQSIMANANAMIDRIAPTPGGGLVVTGTTDTVFVAMLGADGTIKWIQMFSVPPTSSPVSGPVAAIDDAAAIVCGDAGNGIYRVDSNGIQQLVDTGCFEIVPAGDGTFWGAFGGDNLTIGDRTLDKPGTYFLDLAL